MLGPRRAGHREQSLHHPRDLVLARPAVPAHSSLHLLRGVGAGRDPALTGCEQHDPAGLTDGESGARVGAEVQLLDGDRVGAVAVEQLPDPRVDLGEALLERDRGRRLDNAVGER